MRILPVLAASAIVLASASVGALAQSTQTQTGGQMNPGQQMSGEKTPGQVTTGAGSKSSSMQMHKTKKKKKGKTHDNM